MNTSEFIGPLQPYRPSNGTEGECFIAANCDQCEHDKCWRLAEESPCEILSNSMLFNQNDPHYPRQWVINGDGQPECLQYLPEQDADYIPRCKLTQDLFGGEWECKQ